MKKLIALCLLCLLLPWAAAEEEYPFTVCFLDVGQGDCAVVIADGHAMLIDGGASSNSSKVYSFLKSNGIKTLDFVVASHPDSDHIGGIPGAFRYATVGKVFCTVSDSKEKAFLKFKKETDRLGLAITVPEQGDSFWLGGARVDVLMPVTGAERSDNCSIVLRISYGAHSFLFMGDCEETDENVLLASKQTVESTVLKVAHHGSSSSTGEAFIKAVRPQYAVISVAGNNDYFHPTSKTLGTLKRAGVILYRTDMQGTVVCRSNGTELCFSTDKNANANTYAFAGGYRNATRIIQSVTPAPAEECYIINTSTKVFHRPGCANAAKIKEKNKKISNASRDLLLTMYNPCGHCNP